MASDFLFCPHCGAAYLSGEKQCAFCQHIFTEELDLFDQRDLFHERYQILNQIGTGGFGAVYRARDTQERQRLVAIKQINLRGLTAQEIIEATDGFNRERQFLSSLTHDHLPRIYDHFMDAEHWYLIMEFIEGETLESYLQSLMSTSASLVRALSVDEMVDIGLQLCDVLSYLHGQLQPIIFRDLKPTNIMRTDRGAIYLIDFGIARYFKPGKLKDTIPFGSPGYAAPEQYGKGQTTAQADIYSLGALLYYMLSGLDPADNPFHFAPLRLYGTAGLAELEALIMQMVSFDAQQRPSAVQVVTIELQRIRRLRGSSEHRIWYPPTTQNPIGATRAAGTTPYWPGSGGQSGQQMFQMSAHQAHSQWGGAQGVGRRTFMKKGWHIALTVGLGSGVGSILIGNIISSSHSSSDRGGSGPPLHSQAHVPTMQIVHSESVQDVANITKVLHSPYGPSFAVADQAGNVSIWSITAFARIAQFHVPQPVTSLSWSLDAKYLSIAAERSVYTWEAPPLDDALNSWRPTKDPWVTYKDILPATVRTVSWDPIDPMSMAVGDVDGNVKVFNLSYEDGTLVRCVYQLDAKPSRSRPPDGLQTVVLSWPNGLLYSLYDRNLIDVWNSESAMSGGSTITFAGLNESIQAVLWLPSAEVSLIAAVLTVGGQVSFVDKYYNAKPSSLKADTVIHSLAYSDDLHYIFGVAIEGIYVWPIQSQSISDYPLFFAQKNIVPSNMLSIDYVKNNDGNLVIIGGENGLIQVWSVKDVVHNSQPDID